MHREPLIGIVIQGVGSTTAKTGGECFWYSGARTRLPVFASSYSWTAALKSLPMAVDDVIDLATGKTSTSGFTFRLTLGRDMEHLQRFLWRASRGVGALTSALDSSSTTLNLNVPGLDGTPVYIGGETIVLGSYLAGQYSGCTRAYWSSDAQAHEDGSIVYTEIPEWVGREVQLLTRITDEPSEKRRWRGYIAKPPRTSDDGMTIELVCEGVLGVPEQTSVRRYAEDINAGRALWYEPRRGVLGELADLRGAPVTPTTAETPAGATTHVQVGTALVAVTAGADGVLPPVQFGSLDLLLGSQLEVPDVDEGTGRRVVDAPAWEVLVFQGVHPLDAVRALLGLDGPSLGETWRLDFPWIDGAALEALADARPWERVDHLILGWDGQEVPLWYAVQYVLLRPFGYQLGLTPDHTFVPMRMRTMSLADWNEARTNVVSPYRDGPQRRELVGAQVDELSVRLGSLPWRDGHTLRVKAPGIESRRAQLIGAQTRELDLRALSRYRLAEVEGSLLSHLIMNLRDQPAYTFALRDSEVSGADLTLGGRVAIANVGGIGHQLVLDGELVSLGDATDQPRLAGQIRARKFDLQRFRYEITVQFTNIDNPAGFIRERAPSALVESHDDGTGVITLKAGGFSTADGDWFSAGDEIQVRNRDGSVWSAAAPEVGSQTSLSLTVPAAAFGSNIPAGSVIRLASSASYANSLRYPAITDRPYTYLADANEEILRPGPELVPGDVYGAELGAGIGGETGRVLPSDWNGDAYRHLDSVALAAYQPHDVALMRGLDAALRYVERTGDPVTWTPLSGNAGTYAASSEDGIRTWATWAPGEIFACPWVVPKGCESVEVRLWHRGYIEQGTPIAALALRVSLDELASVRTNSAAADVSGNWICTVFTITLSAPPVDDLLSTLRISLDGLTRGDTTHSAHAYAVTPGPGQVLEAGPSVVDNPYADDAGTRPRQGTQDLLISASDESPNTPYDHLRRTDLSGNRGMWVRTPAQATELRELQLWPLPYVQIRSAEIRPVFQATDVGLERYDARQPVLGSDDILMRQRILARYRRPRALWVGPVGDRPAVEDNWPDNYHEAWLRPIQDGLGSWTTYVTGHGMTRGVRGTLRLYVDLLPLHYITSYSSGGDVEQLLGAATRAAWRFRVSVLQLANGVTAPSATIVGAERLLTLDHAPLDDAGASTALKCELIRAIKEAGGAYVYKEGMRYAEDQQFLTRLSFALPFELASPGLPIQVQLEGKMLSADNTEIEWKAGAPGPERQLDTLQAWVVGASVWEVSEP